MIEAVSVGTLLVPTLPLAVVVTLIVAVAAAGWIGARLHLDPSRTRGMAEGAAWMGLLGARAGYVIANWGAFRAAPWTALYFWQPGYLPYAGLIAGMACASWRLARQAPSMRGSSLQALGGGYLVGAVALGSMLGALHLFAPGTLVGRGDRVPDFALVDLAGDEVRLSDLSGRGVVLNFWATWCPPCRREMPLLDAVHAEFEGRGVSVIGIDVGESPGVVSRFAVRADIHYPVWVDGARLVGERPTTRILHAWFAGVGLPTTVFIGPDGLLREVHVGELSRAYLLEQVESLLSR